MKKKFSQVLKLCLTESSWLVAGHVKRSVGRAQVTEMETETETYFISFIKMRPRTAVESGRTGGLGRLAE